MPCASSDGEGSITFTGRVMQTCGHTLFIGHAVSSTDSPCSLIQQTCSIDEDFIPEEVGQVQFDEH